MKSASGGDYRWCRISGDSCRDTQGVPLAIGGTLRDIHQQHLHTEALELAATRFDISREMLHDGLWDIEVVAGDPANPKNTIWWSPQMRRLLGCNTVEEFPNTLESWTSRLHPDDSVRAIAAARHRLMWIIDSNIKVALTAGFAAGGKRAARRTAHRKEWWVPSPISMPTMKKARCARPRRNNIG